MKNNFTNPSAFLLFRFVLFPPSLSLLPSFTPSYLCSKSLSAFPFPLAFNPLQRPIAPAISQTVLRFQ
jgi:hypothetical protein